MKAGAFSFIFCLLLVLVAGVAMTVYCQSRRRSAPILFTFPPAPGRACQKAANNVRIKAIVKWEGRRHTRQHAPAARFPKPLVRCQSRPDMESDPFPMKCLPTALCGLLLVVGSALKAEPTNVAPLLPAGVFPDLKGRLGLIAKQLVQYSHMAAPTPLVDGFLARMAGDARR